MQSLVSKANAEVKELRQSIDLLKAEVERMEVKYISSFILVVLYIVILLLFRALRISDIRIRINRVK